MYQWYKLCPIIYLMLNLPCLCKDISKQGIYNYLVFRGILRTYVHNSERIVQFRQKLTIKCICIICPRYLLHTLISMSCYWLYYYRYYCHHWLLLLLPLYSHQQLLYIAAALMLYCSVLLLMYPLCY